MRLAKALFNFYLEASMHVALSATALVGITALSVPLPWNVSLLGFVFFGTVVYYNFVKYGVGAKKYLVVSTSYHKRIQGFSFVCLGIAFYFLSCLSWDIWGAVAVLGLLAALYAVPVLPHKGNLRGWGGLKIYIVALVWTGVTVGLPLIAAQRAMTWDLWVLVVQRFVLVTVLMLPFEIRDLPQDDKRLRTLPQVLGVRNTQRLGVVLVGVFFVLTLLYRELSSLVLGVYAVLSVLLAWACWSASAKQSRYFASFWVEGIPIVGLALLGVAQQYL